MSRVFVAIVASLTAVLGVALAPGGSASFAGPVPGWEDGTRGVADWQTASSAFPLSISNNSIILNQKATLLFHVYFYDPGTDFNNEFGYAGGGAVTKCMDIPKEIVGKASVPPQELVFRITTPSQYPGHDPRDLGQTYLTGPGTRNPDGMIHAKLTQIDPYTIEMAWEDLKWKGPGAPPSPYDPPVNDQYNWGDCRVSVEALPVDMQLPWQAGTWWAYTSGAGHNTPGQGAMDFAPPSPNAVATTCWDGSQGSRTSDSAKKVRPIASGTVIKAIEDTVEIQHDPPNNFVSGYFHLADIDVEPGDRVTPEWHLGYPSTCSYHGYATGIHVHFYLVGRSTVGLSFGGWTVGTDNCLHRGGTVVCANGSGTVGVTNHGNVAPPKNTIAATSFFMETGETRSSSFALGSQTLDVQIVATHASDIDIGLVGPGGPISPDSYAKNDTETTFGKAVLPPGDYDFHIIGNQLDPGGETVEVAVYASASEDDTTPPTIVGSFSPPPNGLGWNNTDVTVHFVCSDYESGVGSCTGDIVLASEGRNQYVTGTACDNAGNCASTAIGPINIDKTPPVTGMAHDPPAPNGKRGWYISDVTFTLDPQDPLLTSGELGSGVQFTMYQVNGGPWLDYSVTGPFVVGTESWDNVVKWYSQDNADNVEATQEFHFKLDKTPPENHISEGSADWLHWNQAQLERGILANDWKNTKPGMQVWKPGLPVRDTAGRPPHTLRLEGGATDNLCLWETRGVNEDLPVVSAPGNEQTSMDYKLYVPLHLGINNVDDITEDCAGWEKAIHTQVVYVALTGFSPKTTTSWHRAVGGGGGDKYTAPQMDDLLSYVNVVSDVFGPVNMYGATSTDNYRGLLSPTSGGSEARQKAQLLAAWLNLVSGRVAVNYLVDLRSVPAWARVVDNTGGSPWTYSMNVVLQSEEIDILGVSAKYATAANLLDAFNRGRIMR
jgi:hypothetical protein